MASRDYGVRGFSSRVYADHTGAALVVAAGNTVTVPYDTKYFDGLNEFDEVVRNRFTPRKTGYYLICVQVNLTAVANSGQCQVRFTTNLPPLNSTSAHYVDNAIDNTLCVSRIIYLRLGDNVEIHLRNNTLGNVTIAPVNGY